MLVRHCMTRDVVSIPFDATVAEAFRLMRDNRLRRAPVLSGTTLVGIVTENDLLRSEGVAAELRDQPTATRSKAGIATVMSHEPITVSPSTHLEDAARLLLEHRIGALPVLEKGHLVGIVTDSDLLKIFVHQNSRSGAVRLSLRATTPRAVDSDPVRLCLESGMRLRALYTLDSEDAGEILTLHVEGPDPQPLVQRLAEAGFVLFEREGP